MIVHQIKESANSRIVGNITTDATGQVIAQIVQILYNDTSDNVLLQTKFFKTEKTALKWVKNWN